MKFELDVLAVVRQAGDNLLPFFGKANVLDKKTPQAFDEVTEQDKKTEEMLAVELRKIDPTIDFVGEEFGGNLDSERFWLCDPIDGTSHFIRGLPFCTTMLCLVREGEVICSCIYDFVRQDMYHATKGHGAFLNNKPICVSKRPLSDSYICIESTDLKDKKALAAYLWLREKCITANTVNAGFEYANVAAGKFDARITLEPCGKPWDHAPGALLVKEAGGIVVNTGKDTYDYRNVDVLATNPILYKELKAKELV